MTDKQRIDALYENSKSQHETFNAMLNKVRDIAKCAFYAGVEAAKYKEKSSLEEIWINYAKENL